MPPIKVLIAISFLCFANLGCQSGFGSVGNENGSGPLNEGEELEYRRAIYKCYKTGGTRVVKIKGKLRCYN